MLRAKADRLIAAMARADGTPLALMGGAFAFFAVLYGGYTGKWLERDAVHALLAALLIAGVALRFYRLRPPVIGAAWGLASLFVAVPLLQLVPLPPWLWTSLPGHGPVQAVFETSGLDVPWFPVSTVPLATWLSAAAMGFPLAFFVLGLVLPPRGTIRFLQVASLGLASSLLLGALQSLFPASEGLRVLGQELGISSGFFENPNHFGFASALLIMLLPAVLGRLGVDGHSVQAMFMRNALIAIIVTIVVVIGISSGSRAAIILSVMALIFLALEARQQFESRLAGRMFMVLSAGIALLYFSAELTGTLKDTFFQSEHRPIMWVAGLDLAWAHFPFGTGVGTFELAYLVHEPVEAMTPFIINEAHNLYIQILVEWGFAGAVLMALAAYGLVLGYRQGFGQNARDAALKVWTENTSPKFDSGQRQLKRVCVAGLVLVMVHGLVDYPERTMALSGLLAFMLGYVFNVCPLPAARMVRNVAQKIGTGRSRPAPVRTPHRPRS